MLVKNPNWWSCYELQFVHLRLGFFALANFSHSSALWLTGCAFDCRYRCVHWVRSVDSVGSLTVWPAFASHRKRPFRLVVQWQFQPTTVPVISILRIRSPTIVRNDLGILLFPAQTPVYIFSAAVFVPTPSSSEHLPHECASAALFCLHKDDSLTFSERKLSGGTGTNAQWRSLTWTYSWHFVLLSWVQTNPYRCIWERLRNHAHGGRNHPKSTASCRRRHYRR